MFGSALRSLAPYLGSMALLGSVGCQVISGAADREVVGAGGAGSTGGAGGDGGDGGDGGTGGTPVVAQPDGSPCDGDDGCVSGSCPPQDGICCATPCLGACEACREAKTGVASGTCAPIPANQNPDQECDDNATKACDGVSTCKLRSGEICGEMDSCITGTCPLLQIPPTCP